LPTDKDAPVLETTGTMDWQHSTLNTASNPATALADFCTEKWLYDSGIACVRAKLYGERLFQPTDGATQQAVLANRVDIDFAYRKYYVFLGWNYENGSA